jgi:UDP-glucose 4-epimerase
MNAGRHALVTGGAGFVGSVLARRLIRDGFVVTIVDDLSNGKRSNLPEGATFVHADLAEESTYERLAGTRFDVIFHVAAQASNAISVREPLRDLGSNQVATLRLLEYARRTGCMRFLFTSSMSTYGDASRFPTEESEPLRPRSPYAIHKAACEDYLRVYGTEFGIRWTAFRLYTTYGGGQNLDNLDQGLLSIYLAYLARREPIVVKGSLERKRDIVHVSDVVNALATVVDRERTYGRIYNLCSGESRTIGELLRALIRETGEDPDSYPIIVEDGTPGDPWQTEGSYRAAEADFGFVPRILPLEGVRLTARSLQGV